MCAARTIDRIGNGIRAAPRDALVADVAPRQARGAAFGLRQALDKVGALLGPLLAVLIMLCSANDYRLLFWLATIPAVLAVLLLLYGVREPAPAPAARRSNPLRAASLRRLGRAYWWVVLLGALFTLARFSEAFLVLRAHDSGIALAYVPLVMAVLNLAYAGTAYPFGRLSDRTSHRRLLAAGLALLVLADLVLAGAAGWPGMLAGVTLWGLHLGVTQGLLSAMVAANAPPDLRATAFGFFNLFSGLATFVASITAGLLWQALGPAATFLAGAGFAGLALLVWAVPALLRQRRRSHRARIRRHGREPQRQADDRHVDRHRKSRR